MNSQSTVFIKECGKFSEIKDLSIDIIITSPPYNIRHKYITYEDDLPLERYFSMLKDFISASYRVLRDNGLFVIDFSNFIFLEQKIWFASKFIQNECQKAGFFLHSYHPYFISIGDNNFPMEHCFDQNFLSSHIAFDHSPVQTIFVFSKKGGIIPDRIRFKNIYQHQEYPDEVFWPTDLIDDFLHNFNLKNKTVLDPFMGCGHLGLKCQEEGCTFWGYDVEKQYVEVFLRDRNEGN